MSRFLLSQFASWIMLRVQGGEFLEASLVTVGVAAVLGFYEHRLSAMLERLRIALDCVVRSHSYGCWKILRLMTAVSF